MSLASRLVKVEQAVAPAAPELTAAWEARQTRFWEALEALLNTGMPRPFAEQVHAELLEPTHAPAVKALTHRATSLAQSAAWAPEAMNPRRGPLAIPEAHCVWLTTAPDDCDFHGGLRCQVCYLEAPTHRWRSGRGSVGAPWASTCAHCDGALAYPPGWSACRYVDGAGQWWCWTPDGPQPTAPATYLPGRGWHPEAVEDG